jgi:glutathione synthase/RimK-type ligase-like ATP-grasp enzyme
MILIVTAEEDEHADLIAAELNILGQEFMRINPRDLQSDVLSKIYMSDKDADAEMLDLRSNKLYSLAKVRSAWWRRPDSIDVDVDSSEKDFATDEWIDYFSGILESNPMFWINHPKNIRSASLKIEQLARAKRFGFSIPSTIVTNSKNEVLDFYKNHKNGVIFKVLTDPFLNPKNREVGSIRVVKTTIVTDDMLKSHLKDSLLVVPCQFQELISKKYELRVTIIGNKVFSCQINSQENEKTKLDWRDYSVEIPFLPAQNLPIGFEKACLEFVKSYGLNYGALDFIVTPENEYVFLENNPNGQFYFVEKLIPEFKMKQALVDCLVKGSCE